MYYFGIDRGGHYLFHHGIQGMKWGVRRFQNSDGSLTAAGKKRYGSFKTNMALAYGKYNSKTVDKLSRDPDVKRFVKDNLDTFKQRDAYAKRYDDTIEAYCGMDTKRFKQYVKESAAESKVSFNELWDVFKNNDEDRYQAQDAIIEDDSSRGIKAAIDAFNKSESYLDAVIKVDDSIIQKSQEAFPASRYSSDAGRMLRDAVYKCYNDNKPHQVVNVIKL